MKSPLRLTAAVATALAVSAASLVMASTATATTLTGSATVADPADDTEFDTGLVVAQETKAAADITGVDVSASTDTIDITVSLALVPDGTTHGAWYEVDVYADDYDDAISASLDTGRYWLADGGPAGECSTLVPDPAAGKIRLSVPRDCLPDSETLTSVEVSTTAYPVALPGHDAIDELDATIFVPLSPVGTDEEVTGPKVPKKEKKAKPGKKPKKEKKAKPGKKPKKPKKTKKPKKSGRA